MRRQRLLAMACHSRPQPADWCKVQLAPHPFLLHMHSPHTARRRFFLAQLSRGHHSTCPSSRPRGRTRHLTPAGMVGATYQHPAPAAMAPHPGAVMFAAGSPLARGADVCVVTSDGQTLHLHKVLLSMWSTLLQDLIDTAQVRRVCAALHIGTLAWLGSSLGGRGRPDGRDLVHGGGHARAARVRAPASAHSGEVAALAKPAHHKSL